LRAGVSVRERERVHAPQRRRIYSALYASFSAAESLPHISPMTLEMSVILMPGFLATTSARFSFVNAIKALGVFAFFSPSPFAALAFFGAPSGCALAYLAFSSAASASYGFFSLADSSFQPSPSFFMTSVGAMPGLDASTSGRATLLQSMYELGEGWKELSASEKKPYEAEAAELKAKYAKAHPDGAPKKAKAAKGDGEKKAKTPNAFMAFTKEKRAEVVAKNPGIKMTDISKVIGEMWGKLSAAEKDAYKAE